MKRVLVLALLSCGAGHHDATAHPEPLPTHVDPVVDAGAPASACLAPHAGASDFAAAKVLWDAKQWAEAGTVFRAIAFASPDDATGIYAAQLYLESLNQLASGGRKVCFENMSRDLPALRGLYCGARRAKNEDTCTLLDRIQLDLGRMRGEAFAAREDFGAAAQEYFALVKDWCMPAKQNRCDELAYNAALSFFVAGDVTNAKRVHAIMVDPANKMQSSPLVEKLECRIDPTSHPKCQ